MKNDFSGSLKTGKLCHIKNVTATFSITSDDKFDPNEISAVLNIPAERAWRKGKPWRTLPHTDKTVYRTFSQWAGCKQRQPIENSHEQCLNIVRQLRFKTAELLRIKQKYHAQFILQIVPKIQDSSPAVFFDQESIKFCYQTGVEIDVDIYIYAAHDDE